MTHPDIIDSGNDVTEGEGERTTAGPTREKMRKLILPFEKIEIQRKDGKVGESEFKS